MHRVGLLLNTLFSNQILEKYHTFAGVPVFGLELMEFIPSMMSTAGKKGHVSIDNDSFERF